MTAVKLDIPNPEKTLPGLPTIAYDANGNRTSFSPYGTTDTYTLNNLNEYTARNSTNAAYDNTGNITMGVEGSSYVYDAQNRLTSASKSGTTETFKYDGLNRQVSRTVSGTTTYNVYDGWDLIEEYQSSGALTAQYLYGAGGLVKNLVSGNYYYQDGSGSTSHLADSAGHLLEWYRYDLQGTPVFYNFLNTQQPASAYGIRHLFTGQQWYSELGLYDLRNRFYSPDIGRFLQTDPIGFKGDASNLYRYCGNNPLTRSDPNGNAVQRIGIGDRERDPSEPSGAGLHGAAGISDGAFGFVTDVSGTSGIHTTGDGSIAGVGINLGGMLQNVMYNGGANPGGLSYNGQPVLGIFFGDPGGATPFGGSFSFGWTSSTGFISGEPGDTVSPVIEEGNLAIDVDGTGPTHGDPYANKNHETSYKINGVSLNSDVDPYVAAPSSAQSLGVRAGDLAFLIGNGQWIATVVGDFGSPAWGEASIAAAHGIGVGTIDIPGTDPVPNTPGGRAVPVTVIVIPSIPRG